MTGRQIKGLRKLLGLERYAFAETLGVALSTLYRWENSRKVVKMDPLQAKILGRLAQTPRKKFKQLGSDITNALIVGGNLAALVVLIQAITESKC